ncbi:transglutaminase domain-containing protein [Dactylosporangium sp. NPDC005572]|uniref:transglutaminase domain-containing protein n=1 Tax=Dactylosporangium sp. NPDC005572 TaxID=3156889 RepID=UPI0033A0CE5A
MTSDESVAVVVERINRVPDRFRAYTEPQERATRFYRIPPELLTGLLDHGLPHARDGDRLLFDRRDLKNVVLRLSVRSPQHTALRSMAEALEHGSRHAVVRRTLNVTAGCPAPGHEGDCDVTLAAPVRAAAREVTRMAGGHYQIAVEVPGGPAELLDFGPAHWQLVEAAAALEFHRVPYHVIADVGFTAETGLADCRSATRYLVHVGRRLGLDVRPAAGIHLSRPFANTHCWLELRIGGEWRTADPFFNLVLGRWGIVDGAAWPANRVPKGAFWRLTELLEPVMHHGDTILRPSLLVR